MQQAPRVHRDPREVQRLNGLVARVDDGMRVELVFVDGSRTSGAVVTKPALQVFEDADGTEGMNALIWVNDPLTDDDARIYWLDEVLDVVPLGDFLDRNSDDTGAV